MIGTKDIANSSQLHVLIRTRVARHGVREQRVGAVARQGACITHQHAENRIDIQLFRINCATKCCLSLPEGSNSVHHAVSFTIQFNGIHPRITGDGSTEVLCTDFLIPKAQDLIGLLPLFCVRRFSENILNIIHESLLALMTRCMSIINNYIENGRQGIVLLWSILTKNVKFTFLGKLIVENISSIIAVHVICTEIFCNLFRTSIGLILISEWCFAVGVLSLKWLGSTLIRQGSRQKVELVNRLTLKVETLTIQRIVIRQIDGHLSADRRIIRLRNQIESVVNVLTSTHKQVIKTCFLRRERITLITQGVTQLTRIWERNTVRRENLKVTRDRSGNIIFTRLSNRIFNHPLA